MKCDNCIHYDICSDIEYEYMKANGCKRFQESIRCKNCVHWKKQENSAQGRCVMLQIYPTGSWSCADAKRRGVLQYLINEAIDIISSCAYCPMLDSDYCCTAENKDCHRAKELAVEVLKKQIAKKPSSIDDYEPKAIGICPECGTVVLNSYLYCTDCGQKLKWGDEND